MGLGVPVTLGLPVGLRLSVVLGVLVRLGVRVWLGETELLEDGAAVAEVSCRARLRSYLTGSKTSTIEAGASAGAPPPLCTAKRIVIARLALPLAVAAASADATDAFGAVTRKGTETTAAAGTGTAWFLRPVISLRALVPTGMPEMLMEHSAEKPWLHKCNLNNRGERCASW